MIYDLIILGAGASGLMIASKYKDLNIAIVEGNSKIAEKIKISGGGKCNVTNANVNSSNFIGDWKFISSVFNNFDQNDLLEFLNTRGCFPKIKKDSQYFCESSSSEIIDIFKKEIKEVDQFLNTKVTHVVKNHDFEVNTDRGVFKSKKLVVATGGVSFPNLGASDIAFKIAKYFGHSVNQISPALVGFTLQSDQFWMKDLSGVSLRVIIKIANKRFHQDMLFAHKGISGPAVLNASLYWQKGSIEIDFLANKKLKTYLKGSKKKLSTVLPLPKRFIKTFLNSICLDDKKVDELNDDDKQKLSLLKSYTFAPAGNFGYQKAEVTKGGISTDEINVNNMMSKTVENLYFIGECLDVNGELGGYNFQWAFSSAQKVII